MRSISHATLGALAHASSTGASARFLADETRRFHLGDVPHTGAPAAYFAGKSIVLALPRQLDTAVALLALDGIARRIVLWPPDAPADQFDAAAAAAGADIILRDWTWQQPGPHAGTSAQPTEWVLFTSGTTGRPKMVVHTLASLAGHLFGAAPAAGGPVWCTFYDIRRYGGMQILLRALIGGGSLVLSCPEEAPGAFLARAASAGATHFLGTPSHWRRALMTEEAPLLRPAYVRLSGEVADQMILDRLHAAYPSARLVHAFAATEAGLAFEVDDGLAGFPPSVVERAGGAADIRIQDGALFVRSARNAAGYLNGQVSALNGDGDFVDTGDIVELRDGRYHFAGRRDGIVNVGGQKVHPEEVEAVINQHPGVRMSLARARRNPITGAVVVADVVLADGGNPIEEIRALCRAQLAPHKVPVSIRIVPSLEIAPSGKLVRRHA
jgi:acyl-CoA synthetase (AMP-forming)/AMP-acid ligase II